VFYQCDSQSRVSVQDNTAIYHGDDTKYWLPLTDAEEWDSSKTDFTLTRSAAWLSHKKTQPLPNTFKNWNIEPDLVNAFSFHA
jgi:hypothetical protein